MVSIIVLFYNSEKYLRRCLDSIKQQTYEDYEVLLVDDGSTDSSAEICQNYSMFDKRFKLHSISHRGISASREYGLYNSSGDYIIWIDSDDWVEADMLEKMIGTIKLHNCELVSCCFNGVFDDRIVQMKRVYETKENFLKSVLCDDWGVLWKIMAKRSLYVDNNIHFPQGIDGGEDYVVVSKLLFYAKSVKCLDDFFYNYNCNNKTSFIQTPTYDKIFYQIQATKAIESFFEEKGCIEKYNNELRQRKTYVKAPLKEIDYKLWRNVFPEVNYYIDLDNDGKVKAFIRKVLHKMMEIL